MVYCVESGNSKQNKYRTHLFVDERKKENLPIIQPSLHFYGLVLEKPSAEERNGCHSKNYVQSGFENLAYFRRKYFWLLLT